MWGVVGKVLALGWSPDMQMLDWTPLGDRGGASSSSFEFSHPISIRDVKKIELFKLFL